MSQSAVRVLAVGPTSLDWAVASAQIVAAAGAVGAAVFAAVAARAARAAVEQDVRERQTAGLEAVAESLYDLWEIDRRAGANDITAPPLVQPRRSRFRLAVEAAAQPLPECERLWSADRGGEREAIFEPAADEIAAALRSLRGR